MEADRRELFVIAGAMFVFLVICVVAMVLFFRQWHRERGSRRKPPRDDRRL